MAHLAASPARRFAAPGGARQINNNNNNDDDDDEFDDEDEDSSSISSSNRHHGDRIRRNYRLRAELDPSTSAHQAANGAANPQETIRVHLNESYFANERRQLVGLMANVRQKLTSLQMFNPVKNQSINEQQQQWDEKEKYTLDSLNEIKGGLDEQFQWTRPEDKREIWGSKLQYFLAITSYSIGLGNVIRFPILVQKNGGLAFIIPFVIMLVVEGIPLFYLELAIGQRMRKAAISCWNLVSPFAAGIGIASAAVSFVIGLYYNTMVAWTLLYLWGSSAALLDDGYKKGLPFSSCPVVDDNEGSTAKEEFASISMDTGNGNSMHNNNSNSDSNSNGNGNSNNNNSSSSNSSNNNNDISDGAECQMAGSYQYYWYRKTLNASPDVDSWSNFNWPIFGTLTLAWLLSYLCLARGLSSSKRVVYVTFTFPYVILTVFFFKATSLKGMSDGVYYLFSPEWSKLADPYVWLQSAAQVFFSLGLGFGGLIALSSYNPVNNNCYKDAIKVSLINFFTSIYAGIVIFAILGYKANIGHEKCLIEREKTIEYYLSDYNLKVIDYGSVFTNIDKPGGIGDDKLSLETNSSSLPKHNLSLADLEGSPNDYYDSSDAIASIRSLDRQLDSASSSGSFDYGDSDTEFIIDASSLISKTDLNKIIEEIPGLQKCSVRDELDQATQGTGLVFVVMAEAINHFDGASVWAFCFFVMLLTLGLDSQFGNMEGLLSSVTDLNLASNSKKRQWITGLICCLSLVISVIMFAHGAGSYMFAIFDEYAGSFSLVLIALFELIAISYLYGLKRFCDDCELMTGRRPPFIIMLSWRYISPILLLIVIVATIREFTVSLTYEAWQADGTGLMSKPWPIWCIILGSLLIIGCVLWIPLVAILRILKINIIPEESLSQCWFPAEELREFHEIQEEHKVTKLERVLFGFRSEDD